MSRARARAPIGHGELPQAGRLEAAARAAGRGARGLDDRRRPTERRGGQRLEDAASQVTHRRRRRAVRLGERRMRDRDDQPVAVSARARTRPSPARRPSQQPADSLVAPFRRAMRRRARRRRGRRPRGTSAARPPSAASSRLLERRQRLGPDQQVARAADREPASRRRPRARQAGSPDHPRPRVGLPALLGKSARISRRVKSPRPRCSSARPRPESSRPRSAPKTPSSPETPGVGRRPCGRPTRRASGRARRPR